MLFRSRRIHEESNRLVQLTHDLVAAQNAVEMEATRKNILIADAEDATKRHRLQIIAEAEHAMQLQNQSILSRLSDIQQEAHSEKAAYDRERNFREHAQGELQSTNSQLLHEASLYRTSVAETASMMQELQAEKAEVTSARQRTHAAFQEGRQLHIKVMKLEAQVAQLIEDNQVAKQTIVQLKAQMPVDAITAQQRLQTQHEQQSIAALKGEVEKLSGSNQMLSSQKSALEQENAILKQELTATTESTTMILENGREQSRRELERLHKELEHAEETAKASAAKILELENEVAELQDSSAQDTAEDEAIQAEIERLEEVREAGRQQHVSLHINQDDEDEDTSERGPGPSQTDEGKAWQDSWEGNESPTTSRGFFPSTESKPSFTQPFAKGTLPREDHRATFSDGKLVEDNIDFSSWPSITAFRSWKLTIKKKIAAASRYSP